MSIRDIGPLDAKIMIIGEAPGVEEEARGIPFCGQSGMLLKQMLLESEIFFKDCYVTNIMNIRPPNNNFGFFYKEQDRKEPSHDLAKSIEYLHQKIQRIRPNIVLCVGAEPLRAVCNKRKIMSWRGSVMQVNGIKVLATYHPSAVLRDFSLKPIVCMDLRKLKQESLTSEHKVVRPFITIKPTIDDVNAWADAFDTNHERYPDNMLSFDIETSMCEGKETVRCISLAFRDTSLIVRSISIPFSKRADTGFVDQTKSTIVKVIADAAGVSSYWPIHLEQQVLKLIGRLFADKTIRKTGINSICFDQPIIERDLGLTINNHFLDAQHAHHCCYMELPKSLNFLTTAYTEYPNYWSDKVTAIDLSEWEYNAMDAASGLVVAERVLKEMNELGVSDLYFKHVHPLLFALSRAQIRGVEVDHDLRTKLSLEAIENMKGVSQLFNSITNTETNIGSPKQLQKILYDKLKYPIQRTREGKVTTDENALKKLVKKYPSSQELQLILKYRKNQKLNSTYLTNELDADGIMRTSYNASGTGTGRLSSSKTIRETGANLQNLPHDMRRYIKARDGCVLVKGDFSQAETRVVSELLKKLGCPKLWKLYQDEGFDIHKWSARGIFGRDESTITKEERQIGKLSNHSGNYGAGPKVLVDQSIKRNVMFKGAIGISYQFSKQILEARHRQLPGLRIWWKSVERKLKTTRVLTTCFGRKRIFFGRLDPQTFRTAYAFEPQSTVGDLTNKLFYLLDNELDDDCHPLLQTHDEVVTECPIDKIDYVIDAYKRLSNVPLWINDDVPLLIPIDISVGFNWKDTYDVNAFRAKCLS